MYHDKLTAKQAAEGADIMAALAYEYGGFHSNTAQDIARIARKCAANGDERGARNCFRTATAAAARAAGDEWPSVWGVYVLFVESQGAL